MSDMNQWIEEFLALETLAVVGATDKEEKWGYKIFQRLQKEGYEVIPIHPRLEEIEGVRCYTSLLEVDREVRGADVVVPPAAVKGVLADCLEKGVEYVWLQPGTESDEVIAFGEEKGLKIIHHNCVLRTLDERASDK